MKITLKDGSVREYDKSMSVYEIASDISEGLAKPAKILDHQRLIKSQTGSRLLVEHLIFLR